MKSAQIKKHGIYVAAVFLGASILSLSSMSCGSSTDSGPSASAGNSSQAGATGAQAGAGGAALGSAGSSSAGASSAGASSAGASSGGAGGGGSGSSGAPGTSGASGAAASGGSGGSVDPGTLSKFSFFVSSMNAMLKLAPLTSGKMLGFGGNLTFGQADGLSGADKICATIAETSMPGASAKNWRAFLSTSKVNAADRIGPGPWYDRTGRLLAQSLADLLQDRPNGANAAIKQDLPNETGTPNHRPDPTKPEDDNHHTLTGSNEQGKLYSASATCKDWTTNDRDYTTTGRPRIGFSWSIQNRTNWISGQDEGGCGAGVAVEENGGSTTNNPIVGSGGGYGGIYCFALIP